MDFNQYYRSLPFIGVLKPFVYESDFNTILESLISKKSDKQDKSGRCKERKKQKENFKSDQVAQ